MNQLSDDEIINQVLNGEHTQFSALVERYKNYVYTLVYNILLIEEDAEEVAQDVFIKAFTNLNKFKHDAKFSTWLYRIAFNTAITAKKKQKNSLYQQIDVFESTFATDDKSAIETQDRKKYLTIALSRLSEADSTALSLFYLKEFSLEEICDIIDTNLSSLKVRLHRARKRLADELKLLLKEEAINL